MSPPLPNHRATPQVRRLYNREMSIPSSVASSTTLKRRHSSLEDIHEVVGAQGLSEEIAKNCHTASALFKLSNKRDTSFSFTSSMIEITVSSASSAKKFNVHRDLYVKTCKAFKDTTSFPLASPEVFELVLQWMYSGDIKDPMLLSKDEETETGIIYERLLSLYTLAEKLGIRHLKNDIMEKVFLLACSSHSVPMRYLYFLQPESALRTLVLDLFTYAVPESEYNNLELSVTLWKELAIGLKRAQMKHSGNPPYQGGLTNYYEREVILLGSQ